MDPKIYHHTSNVLMQYLVKWTRMYWPTLPAWFVIKDATVKQVALNIRDVDKIDIFSWQTVYEMCSFSTDTRSMSSSPHSLVKNRLFKTAPDIDEPLFQFFHTIDLSLIDMTLLDSPLLLQPFHETFISFWRRTSGTLLKHASFFIRILSSSIAKPHNCTRRLWGRETVSKKSVRDITRISCFVTTMKLPHALQIVQQSLWRSVRGSIFQGNAATNFRWSGKLNPTFVGR